MLQSVSSTVLMLKPSPGHGAGLLGLMQMHQDLLLGGHGLHSLRGGSLNKTRIVLFCFHSWTFIPEKEDLMVTQKFFSFLHEYLWQLFICNNPKLEKTQMFLKG